VREPLRVRLAEKEQALALARELAGIDGLEFGREDGGWQVSISDRGGDRLVVQVLDAVRRALAGQPHASATVLLDGREYQLQGE
jgi:3'-phosphoadenosine 5'-phosphosulfate sulfotransferase